MTVTKRSAEIDSVRLLCNILIVFLHASATFQYVRNEGLEFYVWDFICWCVPPILLPTLFFLSGWLLFRNYSNAVFGRKLWSRVRRLMVPYVAWNALFVILYLVAAQFFPRIQIRVDLFGLTTLSGCLSKIMGPIEYPIDLPFWFARTLFVFTLFAPILSWVYRKVPVWGWGMIVAVLLGIPLAFPVWTESMQMVYPVYAMIAFFIGGGMASRSIEIVPFFQAHRALFLPISLVAMVGLFALKWCVAVPPVVYTPLTVLMFPLLWTIATPLARVCSAEWIQKRLLPSSFFIYAGHFLFSSTLLHLVAPHLAIGVGKLTVLGTMYVLIGVPLAVFIHRVGCRIAPRLMRVFDGTL